jgi:hypothetical protein
MDDDARVEFDRASDESEEGCRKSTSLVVLIGSTLAVLVAAFASGNYLLLLFVSLIGVAIYVTMRTSAENALLIVLVVVISMIVLLIGMCAVPHRAPGL